MAIFQISEQDDKARFVVFGLIVAVAFQELFRYLFYRILRKADNGLKKMVEVGSTGSVVSDSRQLLAYGTKSETFRGSLSDSAILPEP